MAINRDRIACAQLSLAMLGLSRVADYSAADGSRSVASLNDQCPNSPTQINLHQPRHVLELYLAEHHGPVPLMLCHSSTVTHVCGGGSVGTFFVFPGILLFQLNQ